MLAALCFSTVMAIALASYLSLCYRTLELSSRSVQGTQSIELAETGMEEALWALNKNDWSSWTITGTTATRTITGFTFDNNVTGRVELTVTSYNGTAGTRTVTVRGVTTDSDGQTMTRTLTSSSAQAPLFVNALAATSSTVTFSSGGTVDSYDSTVGTYASQTPTYAAVITSTVPGSRKVCSSCYAAMPSSATVATPWPH